MKLARITLLAYACLAVPNLAAEERISAMLRPMLNGGSVPTEATFYDSVSADYVQNAPPDAIKEFLPLARAALRDPRPEVRRYGLMCFFGVTLRFSDGGPLLEPYVSDLLSIVDDHASALRPMALTVLSNSLPKPSPKTLDYFAAHLGDKQNDVGGAAVMACTLLRFSPEAAAHETIAFVRTREIHELAETTLRCVREYGVRGKDVSAFLGEALRSADLWIRRRGIEAILSWPMIDRSPFFDSLNRLANDPNEPAEIRSLAADALKN